MNYEGEVQGILQRKENNFWQTFHFLLVKDRLLVFDLDKKGNRSGQIKEVVDLNQYAGLNDLSEILTNKACTRDKGGSLRHKMSTTIAPSSALSYLGIDFPPEYTIELKAVNENQSALTLRSSNKQDVEMWRTALSLLFEQKPKVPDKTLRLKKTVSMTQRRLKHFIHLAESYKTSGDAGSPGALLQTVHDVIVGVKNTIDNAEQLRVTLPRGLTSLSELDQCQTELHQALSTLVLWTNRHVMLSVTSPEIQPEALVTPVTQLVQKMMTICLQKDQYHSPDSRVGLPNYIDDAGSLSSDLSLPRNDAFSLFQQGNIRYSSYSSHSSESYNDSLPQGWSSYNQRYSILSSGSLPEEDMSPDLPPPHPSLFGTGPPLPPAAQNMIRSKSFDTESKRGVLPPPLPPRSRGPMLPPRHSQGSNISGEFCNNMALFESHVYATSQQFMDGDFSESGYRSQASLDRTDHNMVSQHQQEYHVPPNQPHHQPAQHEPNQPAQHESHHGRHYTSPPANCDTGIWIEGSESHRSSSSHYTDSDSDSESDADSGLEDEDMDEPPPLPPKNRLTFSQLLSLRQPPPLPPPLPPRSYNCELKGTPANGAFPEGPPPTLPSRTDGNYFIGAKNYTRIMDRYAPSFDIDEEYLKMSLQEQQTEQQDLQESLYHAYHKQDAVKRPATPPRPVTPPRTPKTVGETTAQPDETDAEERLGILYQPDPAPELLYNYGPVRKADTIHSNIKGGTVDALIAEATIYRDQEFVQTIVFTHTTFISTEEILKKCIKRYRHFAVSNTVVAENCVKLFNDIMSNIWMYLTKPMIDIANEFIQLLFEDNAISLALSLQNTLFTQFQYCKEHKSDLNYSPATSISSETLNWTFLLKCKPRDIALQMTQIDFDKFSKIKLCEILKYVKAPSETTSPNMCSFVNHFNSVSFWASSLVLKRESKDDRQRVYRRLLSVMEHLIKLNNFSSAFALFAALCKTAVKRVVNLSSKQEKILSTSQSLMDSSESYKNLRSALRSATPPLIAYLGLCMADLTFLIHGNPDLLESGHINFTKRHLTYNFMNVVRKSQEVPYNIAPRPDIISFFSNFSNFLEEEEMWQRSEQIKPRKRRN